MASRGLLSAHRQVLAVLILLLVALHALVHEVQASGGPARRGAKRIHRMRRAPVNMDQKNAEETLSNGTGHSDNVNVANSVSNALTSATKRVASAQRIRYFGGPVLTAPVMRVYLIFYGLWTEKKKSIIRGFINSLSNSNTTPQGRSINTVAGWWNIGTKYYDRSGKFVSKKVVIAREVVDLYSETRLLTKDDQGQIFGVVANQLRKRALPVDPTGVYFVLTDRTVRVGGSVDGFCGSGSDGYCGFHSWDTYGSTALEYAFVGNAISQCYDSCTYNGVSSVTPNGDEGVDGMVDLVAHEIIEAATNPDTFTGWETSMNDSGEEVADLCENTYGGEHSASNGDYLYNLVGQRSQKFYVQQVWDRRVQACRLNDAVKTAPR